jgi:hypothetical protein
MLMSAICLHARLHLSSKTQMGCDKPLLTPVTANRRSSGLALRAVIGEVAVCQATPEAQQVPPQQSHGNVKQCSFVW